MRTATPLLAALLVVGCLGENTAPTPLEVYGRYTLRSVDGKTVPAVYSQTSNLRLELMGGTINIREDGTFIDSTDVRRTDPTNVRRLVDVAEGAWTQAGDTILLRSTRGERYHMIKITERTLEQQLGTSTLHYTR